MTYYAPLIYDPPKGPAPMTDTTTEETPTPTRGRKADPVTEPMNNWKQAKLRAERARAAKEKVQVIHDELESAMKAEAEAYEALQVALAEQRP